MRRTLSTLLLAASVVLQTMPVQAAIYNPNLILSDLEIRNKDSMSFVEIMAFLESRGGLNQHGFDLNNYVWGKEQEADCAARLGLGVVITVAGVLTESQKKACDPFYGEFMGAAQLIFEAAQRYSINPKYILARIEMEQSLVTTQVPTRKMLDRAAGFAICDGCRISDPQVQKYLGFAKQIDAAAGAMHHFLEVLPTLDPRTTNKCVANVSCAVGGGTVTPANWVTAALMNYTPHIGNERVGGNRLFWNIWQRWWAPGFTLALPEGSLIRNVATGAVALVQNGAYRPIASPSVLATRFASANIIDLGPEDFDAFFSQKPGKPVAFPDQALVRTEADETYLLIGGTKRLIPSEVFGKIGFSPEEVEATTAADIEDYRLGAPVTLDDAFPGGALVQDTTTGGVYYAEGGEKHPILDAGVLQANFPGKSLVPMSPAELEKIPRGAPVSLRDGVLVKGPDNPTVYVIAGGLKRPIPSEDVFLGYGYRFSNVVTVSEKTLILHPTGTSLELIPVEEEPTDAPSTTQA